MWWWWWRRCRRGGGAGVEAWGVAGAVGLREAGGAPRGGHLPINIRASSSPGPPSSCSLHYEDAEGWWWCFMGVLPPLYPALSHPAISRCPSSFRVQAVGEGRRGAVAGVGTWVPSDNGLAMCPRDRVLSPSQFPSRPSGPVALAHSEAPSTGSLCRRTSIGFTHWDCNSG